jgi:APA family basic amino acid/polyamine antiporter
LFYFVNNLSTLGYQIKRGGMNLSRYFIKKPVSQIIDESNNNSLKRSLNAANLVSLGVGAIIGAGIFVLTGKAAAMHAGPAIVLSFILAAVACGLAGLCYAEMASILPVSGSAYTYAYASLGEVFAWAMGWLLVLEFGLASATVAVGWSGYLVSFLKDFNIIIPPALTAPYGEAVTLADGTIIPALFNLPAFLAVLAITGLLITGISKSAKVNNFIVLVKLAVIVIFVLVGIFYIDTSNWSPFIPAPTGNPGEFGYDGVLKAAGVIFFAYIGFETVATAAQETVNPQRNVPIGILGSLTICTILYILVSGTLTGIVPYNLLNVPDPMAVAVDKIGLAWLSFAIKVGAIMGLTSVMLVLLYGQTRVFYMMSLDGLLPKFLSVVHKKYQTPYLNTIFVGIAVALAAGLTPLKTLGDLVSMGTLSAFTIVCISVLYLRKKEPELVRPFRCPLVPWVPLAGIAACAYLIYGIGWQVFVTLKIYFIAGIVVYLLYGQFKSKLAKKIQ